MASTFAVEIPNEEALRPIITDLAQALERGDVVALSGDLGAGKTTFARTLIRMLAGNAELEVPSPTFTLVQAYDLQKFPLVHADLVFLEYPNGGAENGADTLTLPRAQVVENLTRDVRTIRAGLQASATGVTI